MTNAIRYIRAAVGRAAETLEHAVASQKGDIAADALLTGSLTVAASGLLFAAAFANIVQFQHPQYQFNGKIGSEHLSIQNFRLLGLRALGIMVS